MLPDDDGGGRGTTITCSPLVSFASLEGIL
jgi:hypothetical protein